MTSAHDILGSLFAHAAWANRRVLQVLRQAAGDDPVALAQFSHLLAAEHVWLTRLRGEPQQHPVWPTLSLDECEPLAEVNIAGFAALVADSALERRVTYTNSAGRTYTDSCGDILLHVALHGAYHRGSTSLVTRQSGGTPVPTDYIVYVRDVPASHLGQGGAASADAPVPPLAPLS